MIVRRIGFLAGAGMMTIAQGANSAPLAVQGHASRVEVARSDRDGAVLVVRIIPQPGWHTYWLNPGDAGAPPRLEWDRRPIDQTISMETPEKIVADGITSFGFRQPVNLIARVSFDGATTPRGTFSWVMCNGHSCLPERATFSLAELPFTREIEFKVPERARDASWSVEQGAAVLTLPPQDRRSVATAYFFPRDQGALAPAMAQNPSRLAGGSWQLTLRMRHKRAYPIPGLLSVIFRDGTCASYAITAPSSSQATRALGR